MVNYSLMLGAKWCYATRPAWHPDWEENCLQSHVFPCELSGMQEKNTFSPLNRIWYLRKSHIFFFQILSKKLPRHWTFLYMASHLPSWRYRCGGRPEGWVIGLCWVPAGAGWEAAGAGGPPTVWLVWAAVWPGWTAAWPGWAVVWPDWAAIWLDWAPPWLGWATGLGWVCGLCFWVMGLCFSELGPDWEPVKDRRLNLHFTPVEKVVWKEEDKNRLKIEKILKMRKYATI